MVFKGRILRFSSVKVSLKKNLVSSRFNTPKAAKNQKIACQSKNLKKAAPNEGAKIGASPMTNTIIEKAFAI